MTAKDISLCDLQTLYGLVRPRPPRRAGSASRSRICSVGAGWFVSAETRLLWLTFSRSSKCCPGYREATRKAYVHLLTNLCINAVRAAWGCLFENFASRSTSFFHSVTFALHAVKVNASVVYNKTPRARLSAKVTCDQQGIASLQKTSTAVALKIPWASPNFSGFVSKYVFGHLENNQISGPCLPVDPTTSSGIQVVHPTPHHLQTMPAPRLWSKQRV